MDSEHLCGGMVKDMYLEELNAPPFLRFVGDAHDARRDKVMKTVEDTWPPKARIPSLNPPIPCPLSSITFSLGKQKKSHVLT
jgi:hypothetical protein